jgi:thiol-disulfide isomerase/thioredoxin
VIRRLSLFAFLLMLAAGCARDESAPVAKKKVKVDPAKVAGIEVGNLMPAYSADALEGGKFDVAQEKGRVVFLNVWATWCGPCRAEMPFLENLHQKNAPRGLKVVGVSVDEGGVAPVKEFLSAQKITYPIALDPDGRIATMLQTTVLPTSVLIDRSGHIVWKGYGMVNGSEPALTKALEKALGG